MTTNGIKKRVFEWIYDPEFVLRDPAYRLGLVPLKSTHIFDPKRRNRAESEISQNTSHNSLNPGIWYLLMVSRSQGLNGFTIRSLFFEISRICLVSWTTDCVQIQAQCRIRADGIRREQFRGFRLPSPIDDFYLDF